MGSLDHGKANEPHPIDYAQQIEKIKGEMSLGG